MAITGVTARMVFGLIIIRGRGFFQLAVEAEAVAVLALRNLALAVAITVATLKMKY